MPKPISLPVIDMSPLFGDDTAARQAVAGRIGRACEEVGFFYVSGHGIDPDLLARLDSAARRFFALPESVKAEIAMAKAGAAWRGWFPLKGELTSGAADDKEGLYLGEELPADDPRVVDQWPLHGANLWPEAPADLKPAATAYFDAVSHVAEVLTEGVSMALGLDAGELKRRYLARPTRLFRIFHYPPTTASAWGVGEHTDYGLLTLLAQDDSGGLEVKGVDGWMDAPPIAGALVCNIGDMLERLTGGRFISTPHRMVNRSGGSRLSFPFFHDPDFSAVMEPITEACASAPGRSRWDGEDVHAFHGTYSAYLQTKVARVFPDLTEQSTAASVR